MFTAFIPTSLVITLEITQLIQLQQIHLKYVGYQLLHHLVPKAIACMRTI